MSKFEGTVEEIVFRNDAELAFLTSHLYPELRRRLRELRIALKTAEEPEEIWHLKRRIAELTPMLTQCNALAALCIRYYERGYYRDEAYTL